MINHELPEWEKLDTIKSILALGGVALAEIQLLIKKENDL